MHFRCFDTVNSPAPIRSGSSYLVSTPLVFLPSAVECRRPNQCVERSITDVSLSTKKSQKSKKLTLFQSSTVAPEK